MSTGLNESIGVKGQGSLSKKVRNKTRSKEYIRQVTEDCSATGSPDAERIWSVTAGNDRNRVETTDERCVDSSYTQNTTV